MITLRNEWYGLRGVISALLFFGLSIGSPMWFYIGTEPLIPGWFLRIPGTFLVFGLLALFMPGRRYSIA